MGVYTITLERISTGERSASMITRQKTDDAAREYAETAIRQAKDNDLRVVAIELRK